MRRSIIVLSAAFLALPACSSGPGGGAQSVPPAPQAPEGSSVGPDGSATSDGGGPVPTTPGNDAAGSDVFSSRPIASADAGTPSEAGDPGSEASTIPVGTDAAMTDGGTTHVGTDGAVNVSNLPSVKLFLAGDSTVSPYGSASAQQGWGEHLFEFFVGKVTVDNQAFAGRSIKTFMYDDVAETIVASHWSNIQKGLAPGDFVMIEFGINDSSAGSPRFVAIPDFTRLLGVMADAILAKHATPIFVTPSALQYWVNGVETNAREQPYADAMKQVAIQKSFLVDDLNARSVEYLNKIGQAAAAQVYINNDKAHFTLQGATEMAKLTTQELVRIASPLGAYVK